MSYIDDVIVLLGKINMTNLTSREQKEVPEKRLKSIISKSNSGLLNEEIFDTITYFRLRRNYFTHLLDRLDDNLLGLISSKGISLNEYWTSALTTLDFTHNNVEDFDESETIDLLKIIRILLIEIDEKIGGILNRAGIAEYITNELYQASTTRKNQDLINERKRQVLHMAKRDFDITLSDNDMDNAVRTIGWR